MIIINYTDVHQLTNLDNDDDSMQLKCFAESINYLSLTIAISV